jgi:hypothetical protein
MKKSIWDLLKDSPVLAERLERVMESIDIHNSIWDTENKGRETGVDIYEESEPVFLIKGEEK